MKRITRIALLSAMVVFTATSRGNNAKLPLIPYPQKVEQLKAEKFLLRSWLSLLTKIIRQTYLVLLPN